MVASFTLEQWGLSSCPVCLRHMMECRSGTFLSCVKIPRPIHADAFALSLGFFLRSWGWATPRLAGLWGAAQQSLKKKGEWWPWHISMLLIKWVTNIQPKPETMVNKFLYFFRVIQVVVMKEMANLKHKCFPSLHQKCLTEKKKGIVYYFEIV